jgi:hypothetical protein
MKNLIVAVAAIVATSFAPALANGTNNDPTTESVFANQFTGAQNVKWTELENGYHRVFFTFNGTAVEAFYNGDAELVATVRNIFYNQLPMRVIQTMGIKFADAVVIEVKEITNTEGTYYKILLEQKDKKYNLKVSGSGDVLEKEKISSKK